VAPKGIALSTDGNGRWCSVDPRRGTALVVAESALNVACVGARPVALVNCLNFGNPEHPEVMWQLSEAIDGMTEACLALSLPVIGGNVSLYNESRGRDIDPTPVVGTLGLVESLVRKPPGVGLREGSTIVLVGATGTRSSLAGSRWAVELRGHRGGSLPELDLALHARLVQLVAGAVGDARGLVRAVHDVSDGGLAVALAEMAVSGSVGFTVSGPADHVDLFGEAPSRVLIAASEEALGTLERMAVDAAVGFQVIGVAGGSRLVVEGLVDLDLDETRNVWLNRIPHDLGAVGASD
jgi:phosphoribosylformylglycinamidine synthase